MGQAESIKQNHEGIIKNARPGDLIRIKKKYLLPFGCFYLYSNITRFIDRQILLEYFILVFVDLRK